MPVIHYALWFLLISGVLFVIVGVWVAAYFWLVPYLNRPDGHARITGKCGDTMEISLKFQEGKVIRTGHGTDGCVYSLNCVSSAATLAQGKSPDEIIQIDSDTIRECVGGLPQNQMHCAQLAAETLQSALHDYMLKQRRESP